MSRTISFCSLVFGLVLAVSSARGDASDPSAQSALLPSPAESGMPEKIARKEVRRIRREFADVLDQERDKLRAEQSRKRKEGSANRKLRRREWDAQEKIARRAFFDGNANSAERRDYVRDFVERRRVFYDSLKAEDRAERAELDARWKALKESQRTRLNSVEEYLRRSERPLTHLLQREE